MLRVAVHLLSEGRDPSVGYVGDLLQATTAASNHMPHKIFGDDQRGREAVGGELPRVMSREGNRDRFAGGCQGGGSRAPLGATPLGSNTGDSHTLGGFNFGWGGMPYLTRSISKNPTMASRRVTWDRRASSLALVSEEGVALERLER